MTKGDQMKRAAAVVVAVLALAGCAGEGGAGGVSSDSSGPKSLADLQAVRNCPNGWTEQSTTKARCGFPEMVMVYSKGSQAERTDDKVVAEDKELGGWYRVTDGKDWEYLAADRGVAIDVKNKYGIEYTKLPGEQKPAPAHSPTRTFTAEEAALLQQAGYLETDSDAGEFIDSAHGLCTSFEGVTDAEIFGLLKKEPSKLRVVTQIVMNLCPEHGLPVAAASVEGAFADGLYYVNDGVAPGQYKTASAATKCYWERTAADGKIIDNGLVDNAPGGVRVTIAPGDYSFQSARCGIWVPAT